MDKDRVRFIKREFVFERNQVLEVNLGGQKKVELQLKPHQRFKQSEEVAARPTRRFSQ